MINVVASSVVDHELDSHSSQTKDYKIDICFFSYMQRERARIG